MQRIQLILEYDGAAYAGWQRQENAVTVQQRLEEAWLKITGEAVRTVGASRTDAGVHAAGQSVHLDTCCAIPIDKMPYALNTALPADIRALEAIPRGCQFHACFSAAGKTYEYRIINRPHASALLKDRAFHVCRPLDTDRMRAAASALMGEHDFAAFAAAGGSAKTTVRRIEGISIVREGECLLINIRGNGFLYNMVRIIAGTLVYVGTGKLAEDTVLRMIKTRDRTLGGPTAPPQGLTLCRIYYPPGTE